MLKKDNLLKTDIENLESSLAESVEHLNQIEANLQAVLVSFCNMNIQQAENIEAFAAQIIALKTQLQQLIEINNELNSTKDMLVGSTQQFEDNFKQIQMSFAILRNSLLSNIQQLVTTNQELSDNKTALQDGQVLLQQLNTSCGNDRSSWSNSSAEVKTVYEIITMLTNTIVDFNAKTEALSNQSIALIATNSSNTDQIITHAEHTVQNAMLDNCLGSAQEANNIAAQAARRQAAKQREDKHQENLENYRMLHNRIDKTRLSH